MEKKTYRILQRKNNIEYELKNGKGLLKEYDEHDNVKFEGEYLNGEKNGKGKEYDMQGKLRFEGNYINGEKNGKGKEYYNGDLKFEGEYINGYKRKGREYIKGILVYEGYFLIDQKYEGKSFDIKTNMAYELKNGTGKMKEYLAGGMEELEKEFLNWKRNGVWKEYYNGQLAAETTYLNDEKIGETKEYDIESNQKSK